MSETGTVELHRRSRATFASTSGAPPPEGELPVREARGAELPDAIAPRSPMSPEAVARAYRENHGRVRAFVRRMLGDDEAAEDVVHDVFVALPAAAKRFRGDAAPSTFLMAIAANLCRGRLRSASRRRRALGRMERGDVPPEVRTPEADARHRQLAEALDRGLETLSPEHREVFVLCAVEGRTSPEVAEILELKAGTVRARLCRARGQLRAFLEREGFG
jgi:RNA polymerase sigma-70 factor (ECF subfamily)